MLTLWHWFEIMGAYSLFHWIIIFFIFLGIPFFIITQIKNNEKNRIGRKGFSIRLILLFAAMTIFTILSLNQIPFMIFISLVGYLVCYAYGLLIVAKRLNDLFITRYLIILCPIPIIGLIFLLFLCFKKGEDPKIHDKLPDNIKKDVIN